MANVTAPPRLEQLAVVVGPSGSGKRSAMAILEDLFEYVAITKLPATEMQKLIPLLPLSRVVISVNGALRGASSIETESAEWVSDCVSSFHDVRSLCGSFKLLFLYRAQSELERVETTFYHPLTSLCGTLRAAIFKECQMMALLLRALDEHPSLVDDTIFIDTTGLTPFDLRRVLEEHFGPSTPPSQAQAEFVTRGWNRMRDTLEQMTRTSRRLSGSAAQGKANPITCLILGESGTGKELVARRLHNESPGRGPLTRIDCSALAVGLIESELFGHRKGAFTGAIADRKGLVEVAKGGTIFLDEVGLIDKTTQAKLLTFIESGEFRAVGDSRVQRLEGVRIIAATSRDLAEEVTQGRFLKDLYYRLAAATINLPALRHRREDIFPLLRSFLSARFDRLSSEVLAILLDYDWPGNVRELRHVAEHCEGVSGPTISMSDLPPGFAAELMRGSKEYDDHVRFGLRVRARGSETPASRPAADVFLYELQLRVRSGQISNDLKDANRAVIMDALRQRGSVSKAAALLGRDRSGLSKQIKKLGVKKPARA